MSTIKMLLVLRISTLTNLFIYYAQRMPLIGRYIADSLYARLDLKNGIAAAAFLLNVLYGFALRFAYVGLMLYAPVALFAENMDSVGRLNAFYHLLFMLSFVVSAVSSATILEPKREKFVAVKLMRMSPAHYMKAVLLYKYATFLIYLLPAMLLFVFLLDGSALEAIVVSLSLTLWRAGTEYLHAKLYDKTGMILIKHVLIAWATIVVGLIAGYVPFFIDMPPLAGELIRSTVVSLVFAVLGLALSAGLVTYRGYAGVVDAATKRDDPLLNLGKMMVDAQKNSVQTKVSDYEEAGSLGGKLAGKRGYSYLNDIFMARHANQIRKPVIKRIAIIGAVGVIAILFSLTGKERLQALPFSLEAIVPALVLAMYFLSVGEKLCRSFFYNCDINLLRYSFYRKSAPQHFLIRLQKIVWMNVLVAAAVGFTLTVISLIRGGEWNLDLTMLWVSLMALSVFFSVHHLFLYYIFQPYSTELNVKNPGYHVINLSMSVVCGLSLALKPTVVAFALVWSGLALLYVVIALIAVRKYSVRTFRVK
ncbi:hypothetical protein ACX93W_22580 [Paenibacillus sp. CAU 1782]